MNGFSFETVYRDTKTRARLGVIHTPHGDIETPAFVPVGTQATVKTMTPDDLRGLGVRLFFVNTYHTYLRPGLDVIGKAGGLHRFMDWDRPLITDSGGFQVFSLAREGFKPRGNDDERVPPQVKITESGATFKSHWDGSLHEFTPESSMRAQHILGSDIHIAFDDCTPYPVTEDKARRSMERTHRWAVASLEEHAKLNASHEKKGEPYQALYGSIQGSVYQGLREESARFIADRDFDGIAIGGVSVGESKREMTDVLSWVSPHLPDSKPRHLLGVGEIDDIFGLVEHGVDTFDCVQPTRLARMGFLFVRTHERNASGDLTFTMDINKSTCRDDLSPVDTFCACYTCTHFTRAYLHHLFKVRELLAYRLATLHNIAYVNALVTDIRRSIREGTLLELRRERLYNES